MLSSLRRAVFAAALLFAGPITLADAQSHGYFADVADLPLMPELSEIPGAGVIFDKPGGRIVEAYAIGRVGRDRVIAFYRRTLPQLGWRADGAERFRREGESLSLEFLGVDQSGDLLLRFSVKPDQPGGGQ